jgi:hypothetical protein
MAEDRVGETGMPRSSQRRSVAAAREGTGKKRATEDYNGAAQQGSSRDLQGKVARIMEER